MTQYAVVVEYDSGGVKAWGPYRDFTKASKLHDRFNEVQDETVLNISVVVLFSDTAGHARARELEIEAERSQHVDSGG